MAQVPYSPDSNVKADVNAPNDYEHLDVSPNQFGGLIAQGEQQLGAGASKAGQFYGEAAANDASNNFQLKVNGILNGDPNKTVKGPDGNPMPDTGFLGLKGKAQADAWPGVMQQIEDERKAALATLGRPDSQLKFDDFSRRYVSYAREKAGGALDNAYNAWYGEVEKTSAATANQHIANNVGDPQQAYAGISDLVHSRTQTVQRLGAQPGDPVWNAAQDQAKQEGLTTWVRGVATMGPEGPVNALKILNQHKDWAGTAYPALYHEVNGAAEAQTGIDAAKKHIDEAKSDTVAAVVGTPSPAGGPWAKAADGTPVATDRDGNAVPGVRPPAVALAPPRGAAPAPQQLSGDSAANAAGLLRGFEGFRTNAYWDVNHWRTGYGSDTITRADGSIEPVTATSTVTKADAERDLSRRIGQSQQQIQSVIGPEAWSKLSPIAQASLTSVTYNYGHFPQQLVAAAQSGDPQALASAVASLPSNSGRRAQEAAAINGKFTLHGPGQTSAPQTAMTMPNAPPSATSSAPEVAQPDAPQIAAPNAPQPPNASTTQTQPAVTTPSPVTQGVAAVSSPYVVAEQRLMADSTLNDNEKKHGLAEIAEQQRVAQAGYIDEERAMRLQKEAREQASDAEERNVMKDLYAPKPVNTIQSILNNPKLTNAAAERMIRVARTAENEAQGYGPSAKESNKNMTDLLSDMRRPAGDPLRISSPGQLTDALVSHKIDKADFDFLQKQMLDARSPEGEKLSTAQGSFVKNYTSTITRSNPLQGKDDPLGDQKLYQFEQDVQQKVDWYKANGKNPFDLFDPARPDFVGSPKALAPYMTTLQQSLDFVTSRDTNAVAPSSITPPGTVATPPTTERPVRQPSESFADYDARVTAYLAKVKAAKAPAPETTSAMPPITEMP